MAKAQAKAKDETLVVRPNGDMSIHLKFANGKWELNLFGLDEESYKELRAKVGKRHISDFETKTGTKYRTLDLLADVGFWPERE